MSLPNNLDAYEAELGYFQQALEDTSGLRVKFQEYGQANLFTLRMHQCRSLQRAFHKRVYKEGDRLYGRSEYDRLTVRQPKEDPEGYWWVFIERTNAQVLEVQTLSEMAALFSGESDA